MVTESEILSNFKKTYNMSATKMSTKHMPNFKKITKFLAFIALYSGKDMTSFFDLQFLGVLRIIEEN